MCRFIPNKGQNAVEFSVTIGIVMVVFLTVFVFFSQSFFRLAGQEQTANLEIIANRIEAMIEYTQNAHGGFSSVVNLFEGVDVEDYALRLVNYNEIVLTHLDESYTIFLPPDTKIYGQPCAGENEFRRERDYGEFFCCGSCDPLPEINITDIQCSVINDSYFNSCANVSSLYSVDQVRGRCRAEHSQAFLTAINITDSDTLVYNMSSTNYKIRYLNDKWFYFDVTPFAPLQNKIYNFTINCSNATSVYSINTSFDRT